MNPFDVLSAIEPYVSKLASLSSVDEIKNFLLDENAKGPKSNWDSCPIATYVKTGSGCQDIWVGSMGTYADEDGTEKIRHTPAMSEFVQRFDQGEFPELEMEDDS